MITKTEKCFFQDYNSTTIDIGGGNNNFYFRMYCETNYHFPSIGVMVNGNKLKDLADLIYKLLDDN